MERHRLGQLGVVPDNEIFEVNDMITEDDLEVFIDELLREQT